MKFLFRNLLQGISFFAIPILEAFLKLSVARGIVVSFGTAIFFGSFILYFLEEGNLTYIDSLYLSASAFSITGLSPVSISSLHFITKVTIMLFFQAGGLGIIVMTVLIGVLVINNLSRNTKLHDFITEALDTDTKKFDSPDKEAKFDRSKIIRVIISIMNITVTLELLGTVSLYYTLPEDIVEDRFFVSLFTAISAFNNAGFSVFDTAGFLKNYPVPLSILSSLIVIGGIGYPVIIYIEKSLLQILKQLFNKIEIFGETYVMRSAIQGREPSQLYILLTKLSYFTETRIEDYNKSITGESNRVQTKIILYGSFYLILAGFFGILFLEFNNSDTLGNLNLVDKIFNSLFLSISTRTAGFNSIDITNINDPTMVLICLLMFVGGGPQGTAGGIKITTFVILAKYLINVLSSQGFVVISGSNVSKKSVAMSTRLYFLSTSSLAIIIFILTYLHGVNNALQIITFEVISAFSTVGLSLGITSSLGDLEKIIFIFLMYVGRIGIFTVLIAITGNTATSFEDDDGLKIQVG